MKLNTRERTPVRAWHRPLCSWCHRTIDDIKDALAGWESTTGSSSIWCQPEISHGVCGRGMAGRDGPSFDLNIVTLRAYPLRALQIFAEANTATHQELEVWLDWISIVLGLPSLATYEGFLMFDDADTYYMPKRVRRAGEVVP